MTDLACKKAKPKKRPYEMADGGRLYLFVLTSGARNWRLKYRFGDKEKLPTFGFYPEVDINEARDQRDAAKRHLRDGLELATPVKQTAGRAIRRTPGRGVPTADKVYEPGVLQSILDAGNRGCAIQ